MPRLSFCWIRTTKPGTGRADQPSYKLKQRGCRPGTAHFIFRAVIPRGKSHWVVTRAVSMYDI